MPLACAAGPPLVRGLVGTERRRAHQLPPRPTAVECAPAAGVDAVTAADAGCCAVTAPAVSPQEETRGAGEGEGLGEGLLCPRRLTWI